MRICIFGSRTFGDYDLLCKDADARLRNCHDVTVLCGKARGADELGERYARARGYKVEYFLADWDTHGKAAGPIRNRMMVEVADYGLAFWDGVSRGTKNTIELFIAANKPITVSLYTQRHALDRIP